MPWFHHYHDEADFVELTVPQFFAVAGLSLFLTGIIIFFSIILRRINREQTHFSNIYYRS
jgi:hypothetical protein